MPERVVVWVARRFEIGQRFVQLCKCVGPESGSSAIVQSASALVRCNAVGSCVRMALSRRRSAARRFDACQDWLLLVGVSSGVRLESTLVSSVIVSSNDVVGSGFVFPVGVVEGAESAFGASSMCSSRCAEATGGISGCRGAALRDDCVGAIAGVVDVSTCHGCVHSMLVCCVHLILLCCVHLMLLCLVCSTTLVSAIEEGGEGHGRL